jgi:hypothetical protein
MHLEVTTASSAAGIAAGHSPPVDMSNSTYR